MKRYNLKISGRVQGVGYRYFTEKTAISLGVSGWVRNLADGRVEAEIQGSEEVLAEMFSRLNQGPSFGNVSDIVKNQIPVDDSETGFSVKY